MKFDHLDKHYTGTVEEIALAGAGWAWVRVDDAQLPGAHEDDRMFRVTEECLSKLSDVENRAARQAMINRELDVLGAKAKAEIDALVPLEDNTHAVEIVERAYLDMGPGNGYGANILSSIYCHLTGGNSQECYGSVAEWLDLGLSGVKS